MLPAVPPADVAEQQAMSSPEALGAQSCVAWELLYRIGSLTLWECLPGFPCLPGYGLKISSMFRQVGETAVFLAYLDTLWRSQGHVSVSGES